MMYRKQSNKSLISFWSSLSYRVTNDVAVIPVVEYPLHTFRQWATECIRQLPLTISVSVEQATNSPHSQFGQVSQNFSGTARVQFSGGFSFLNMCQPTVICQWVPEWKN